MRFLIAVIAFLTFFASCSTETQQKQRRIVASAVKNVKINFLNAEKSVIHYGDSLFIGLHFEADSPVKKMVLKSNRGNFNYEPSDSLSFGVSTVEMGGGYHNIRVEVLLEDSTSLRGSESLRVVLPEAPAQWDYRLIEVFPHDKNAYTQGLLYHGGSLYESTGRYGLSDVRKVNFTTGVVEAKTMLDDKYFAEGLALFRNELYQLTWREQNVLVYDLESLEKKREFPLNIGNGEGWGLCFDGEDFIFTDGSADIIFANPEDWSERRKIRVFDHRGDVMSLNELEYVGGKIYANMLNDTRIAVIDPENGAVLAYWDLTGLLESQGNPGRVDVMNGIAYRADRSSFLVTGKLWPYVFEISPKFPG